jgi:hypothetical protein
MGRKARTPITLCKINKINMPVSAGCDHYVTKPYSPIQPLRLIWGFQAPICVLHPDA